MPIRKKTVTKTTTPAGSKIKRTVRTKSNGVKIIKEKSVLSKSKAKNISEVPNKRLKQKTVKVVGTDGKVGVKRTSNMGKRSYVVVNYSEGNQKKKYRKMK
jgi:hypothetical protein